MEDNCDHCNLDRVRVGDVLSCTYLSFANFHTDLYRGTNVFDALLRDDRILYFVGLLLVAVTLRMMMTRPRNAHYL